jgi:hypothetical protein
MTEVIQRREHKYRGVAVVCFCVLFVLSTVNLFSASDSHVIFTKVFPNSQPDYFSISVGEDGATTYRTAPDDNSPLQFSIPRDTATEIFRLSEKLGWFKADNVESHRKVANMGKKTFAYQNGSEHYEATFNHTELPDALALTAIFEKISNTEQHLMRLENLIRFDRLGLMKELLQTETDLDQNRLLPANQLLPILEKIRNDRSVANIARDRAVQLIGKIETVSKSEPRP